MSGRSPLRRAYDAVEGAVAPGAGALVRPSQFADAPALMARARRRVHDQVDGISARLWHLVNLPAGTDLQQLRVQLGALDREVRRLTLRLEQAEEVTDDAFDPEPDGSTGPRAPRGGT
jgi:hypothetical protein